MGFGKRLESLIKYRKTNVNRLSKATGIQTQTLYMMIKRDSSSTDMETMGLLANALDVNISYFYDDKYSINESGIISNIEENSNTYLSHNYISSRLVVKKEFMNFFHFIASEITNTISGKLYPTDAFSISLVSYFRKLFDSEIIPFWEQEYVTIKHSFVEYPEFYLAELSIKYSAFYIPLIANFIKEYKLSEDELVEYLYKSILHDYVNLHLKDHILYNAPCIQELVNWKAPFLERKEN